MTRESPQVMKLYERNYEKLFEEDEEVEDKFRSISKFMIFYIFLRTIKIVNRN